MLRTSLLLLAAFFYTSPALAAWGENWGVMVWGAAVLSGVPMVDGRGLGLLGLVLIGLAIRGLRSSATLALMVLVSFVGAADLSSRPRAAGSLRLWPPGRGFEDSPRGASGSPRPARRLALSNLASRAN